MTSTKAEITREKERESVCVRIKKRPLKYTEEIFVKNSISRKKEEIRECRKILIQKKEEEEEKKKRTLL